MKIAHQLIQAAAVDGVRDLFLVAGIVGVAAGVAMFAVIRSPRKELVA